MRKIALIVALLLAPIVALAQYYLRPNLPPQSVIGNPYSINAPAQAIPFSVLETALSGSLLTPTLPSTVDLNNLPPQTVVGNMTSSTAGLGFITFAQLLTFKNQTGLPVTVYNTYDPTAVPMLTMIGNLSSTSDRLALPISFGNFFALFSPGALVLEDGVSFLLLEDASSHICLEGQAC